MKKIIIISLSVIILLIGFFTIENAFAKNRQDYMRYNVDLSIVDEENGNQILNFYSTSDYY